MSAPLPPVGQGSASLGRQFESFSRELLQLLRGVKMYPNGHPSLRAAAERLAALAPVQGASQVAIGVTAGELVVGGHFVGGEGSRAAELAALLYRRKVLQLVWSCKASTDEVTAFAQVLGGTSAEGAELRRLVQAAGVLGIALDPLDLEQVHGQISVPGPAAALTPEERRRQAWLRMARGELDPDELTAVITSPDLWNESALDDLDEAAKEAVGRLLAEAGAQLEAAIACLEDGRRHEALARLAALGRSLPLGALIRLLAEEPEGWGPRSAGLAGLLRGLDADRFVDLLAGMAAATGRVTRRLARVYRSFAPQGGNEALLPVVVSRLSSGDHRGFPAEVWKAVEEFVLRLEEDPFMAEEYLDSLEEISAEESVRCEGPGARDLFENPESHLDLVYVGLAASGGAQWRTALAERLAGRRTQLGAFRALRLVCWAEELLPGLLTDEPAFLRSVFLSCLAEVRDATAADRRALEGFFAAHARFLLDTALKALAEEQRVAGRRVLVDMLAGLPEAAVPALVTRARAGPWYVSRNLATVLARIGSRRAVPLLRELLGHSHPKVRKEAARALESLEATSGQASRGTTERIGEPSALPAASRGEVSLRVGL